MASIVSGGDPFNFNGIAGSSLLTTTSQYRGVGILHGTTTADFTFALANTTTIQCIGINQTYLTSGAEAICTVRLLGISKAFANVSISAGDPVVQAGEGLFATASYALTSTSATQTALRTIAGIALSAASTNGAFTMYVNPSFITEGQLA